MSKPCNVGGFDRKVRAVLGALFVTLAFRSARNGNRFRALVFGVVGFGLLGNALTGYCRFNEAMGIDTSGESIVDVEGADDESTVVDATEPEA